MDISPILAASLVGVVIALLPLLGLVTTIPHIRAFIEKRLTLLSSFSAGVFLMVGIMLIEEVFEGGVNLILVGSVALGALASFALSLIPEYHHHHYEKDTDHKHSKSSAIRILFSDSLHSTGDGILLGAAFLTSFPLGVATSIGIIVHEVLHELSKFFILRQSGFSIKRSVKLNIIVSMTVFVGIALGALTVGLENILLGFAAGSLLAVVLNDLIPSSIHSSSTENRRTAHFLLFAVGALAIFLLHNLIHH